MLILRFVVVLFLVHSRHLCISADSSWSCQVLLYIRNCYFLRFLPVLSICCSLPFSSLHCEILQKTRMWEIGCHSLILCSLNPFTDPCNWSPNQGLVCVHLTTCPSCSYLGRPMLPGEAHVAVLAFSLVGWAMQSTLHLKCSRN